jgi:carboxymethylenebutenolidase
MNPSQPDGCFTAPLSGKSRAVLVLHAWWGLNDTIRTVCARLADAGFTAFAPDLFHGKIARTVAEADALSSAHEGDAVKADVRQASAFLRERVDPARGGLAVLGFSFGAYYAIDLSCRDPEHVRSVVLFYGSGPGDFSASRAEYLGHFAENDEYEPRPSVDRFEESIRKAGRAVTFHHYPGTGHWFFEPDRPDAYNQAAASLAWERTLEFLRRQPHDAI